VEKPQEAKTLSNGFTTLNLDQTDLLFRLQNLGFLSARELNIPSEVSKFIII
jgi:hypothetical protein